MDPRAYNPRIAVENIKQGLPIQPGRGVGKTTGAILAGLSFAMRNPGKEIRIDDPDAINVDRCKVLAHELGRVITLLALTDVKVRVGYSNEQATSRSQELYPSVWVKSDFAHIFKVAA